MMKTGFMLAFSAVLAAGCGKDDQLSQISQIGPNGGIPQFVGGAASDDFWAVTADGPLHYDGSALAPVSPGSPLGSVMYAASRDRLWFWANSSPPMLGSLSASGTREDFSAAVATSYSLKVYASGDTVIVVTAPDNDVLRFDGSGFTSIGNPGFVLSDVTGNIAIVGDNDLYATATNAVAHYDGSAWQTLPVTESTVGTLTRVAPGEAWGIIQAGYALPPPPSYSGGDIMYGDWRVAHVKDGTLTVATQPIPAGWRDVDNEAFHDGVALAVRIGDKPAFVTRKRDPDGPSIVVNALTGTTLGDDIHVLQIDGECLAVCNLVPSLGTFADGSLYVLRQVLDKTTGTGPVYLYAGPVHD